VRFRKSECTTQKAPRTRALLLKVVAGGVSRLRRWFGVSRRSTELNGVDVRAGFVAARACRGLEATRVATVRGRKWR